jgi:hypothetical protein
MGGQPPNRTLGTLGVATPNAHRRWLGHRQASLGVVKATPRVLPGWSATKECFEVFILFYYYYFYKFWVF